MFLRDKTIGMMVGPLFEDLEFWSVYMRIREEGATIRVIGLNSGEEYVSKHGGLTAVADTVAGDVAADDLFALLVPGGFAPDKMRRDPEMLRLVREMDERKKIIGFICHAGWVAASAGILAGRKCTGSTGIRDDLQNAGATWVDAPAFREGNIVWGRVVEDIPEYQRELVSALREAAGA
ncbi:type 1 glutamine amidotransferase domain-containing protein [Salinispira pacifica]